MNKWELERFWFQSREKFIWTDLQPVIPTRKVLSSDFPEWCFKPFNQAFGFSLNTGGYLHDWFTTTETDMIYYWKEKHKELNKWFFLGIFDISNIHTGQKAWAYSEHPLLPDLTSLRWRKKEAFSRKKYSILSCDEHSISPGKVLPEVKVFRVVCSLDWADGGG